MAGVSMVGTMFKKDFFKLVTDWLLLQANQRPFLRSPMKAKDYEFLKPKCDSGSLSWQTEEVNLEYGTETMVRSDQGKDTEVDFIGICRYNGKYGWKYGNGSVLFTMHKKNLPY